MTLHASLSVMVNQRKDSDVAFPQAAVAYFASSASVASA
jgi:hypothetical protein